MRLSIDNSELHHWERPNYQFQTPLGSTQSSGILDFADDEAFSERRGVDPTTGLPTLAVASTGAVSSRSSRRTRGRYDRTSR